MYSSFDISSSGPLPSARQNWRHAFCSLSARAAASVSSSSARVVPRRSAAAGTPPRAGLRASAASRRLRRPLRRALLEPRWRSGVRLGGPASRRRVRARTLLPFIGRGVRRGKTYAGGGARRRTWTPAPRARHHHRVAPALDERRRGSSSALQAPPAVPSLRRRRRLPVPDAPLLRRRTKPSYCSAQHGAFARRMKCVEYGWHCAQASALSNCARPTEAAAAIS